MRYLTYSTATETLPRLGVLDGAAVVDVASLATPGHPLPGQLLDLIHLGPDGWRRTAEAIGAGLAASAGVRPDPATIRFHAPIPTPRKNIVCLGLNYMSHAIESATARGRTVKIPTAPVFFTKATTSVNGPFDDILVDRNVTQQPDWEVELGVVIGVGGRNIARADALQHVFGYTIVNDVSARDVQALHLQWFKGKSLDGFCPIGPWVVTADEFGDPQGKQIALRVNGVTKQSANTKEMIFPVDVIIESLSHGLTIEPGEIIATGTPEGIGLGFTPPQFLQDGDVMETEVEGIGVMRNVIRDAR